MAKGETKDMTVGSPMKLILGFTVPLLFGFLFQQFYGIVDTIIVGQFLGVNALAGVGSTGAINFLTIGFCCGVCGGFAIPVAHKFGAKDYSGMRQMVANCVWLSIIFSVLMTVIVVILCDEILIWTDTPSDIFQAAYDYILIIFIGIPAVYLYNMLSGILRSMGNSKVPLFFLLLSSGLNIVLDLLCIITFQMGVSGAAIATVSSQLISGLLCLFYMIKKYEILHITKEEWKPNLQHMKVLCSMGVPMGLQYSITAIGSVIVQTAVNGLGAMAVAATTAANKVSMFFGCPFDAMGTTMATYGGQNVGARKLERVGQGLKSCITIAFVYWVMAFIVMFIFGGKLNALFVDSAEPEMLAQAQEFLLINGASFFLLALVNIIRYLIQGMGYSTFAIFAGVFELVARSIVAMILVPLFGFTGACFASPLAWVFADAFLIPAYFHVKKRLAYAMERETNQQAC